MWALILDDLALVRGREVVLYYHQVLAHHGGSEIDGQIPNVDVPRRFLRFGLPEFHKGELGGGVVFQVQDVGQSQRIVSSVLQETWSLDRSLGGDVH